MERKSGDRGEELRELLVLLEAEALQGELIEVREHAQEGREVGVGEKVLLIGASSDAQLLEYIIGIGQEVEFDLVLLFSIQLEELQVKLLEARMPLEMPQKVEVERLQFRDLDPLDHAVSLKEGI